MSTGNPQTALDALLETESTKSRVKPLTIARYALLELVESPLTSKAKTPTLANIIPTLYIMCAETEDLRGWSSKSAGELVDEAYRWADGVEDIGLVNELVAGVVDKVKQANYVAPEPKKAEAASRPTAG